MIFLAHVTGVCDINIETSIMFTVECCLWALNNNEKCRQRAFKELHYILCVAPCIKHKWGIYSTTDFCDKKYQLYSGDAEMIKGFENAIRL